MKLSSVLKVVRTTSLRQLSEKDKTDEVIIGYINLALESLYSKFTLKTNEILIALRDGKTLYKLDGTDSDVTVGGNIMNIDDVLMLVEASDEKGSIPINDDTNEFSVYTSGYDELQIPLTADQSYISVIYKQVPEEVSYIDSGDGSAAEHNIPLPIGLRAALFAYIKFAAFESQEDSAVNNANEARYEKACRQALDDGVILQDALVRPVSQKGFEV